ncbi:MAG: DUF4136 domain-containing protein [Bacteroidota bacterium]
MIKRFLFFGLLAALVAGCYPGGAEYTDELDLVATTYNKDYAFTNSNTFAIPDKIPKIDGDLGQGEIPKFVDDATAKVILDGIKSNLTELGYTEVTTDADVVVTVAALEVTTTTVYCNDWWYGGWWGYYPGYPGYGGCYYPSAYTYSTGTIFISMVDDKLEDGIAETPLLGVWGAALNGLLQSSSSSTNIRITNALDHAFEQSPYLKTN